MKDKEKARAYNREYYQRRREYMIAKAMAWRAANPDWHAATQSSWKNANREIERQKVALRRAAGLITTPRAPYQGPKECAHRAVSKAVKSGRLKRTPCWVCGNPKTHAHHSSYDRDMRLLVVWLCPSHH